MVETSFDRAEMEEMVKRWKQANAMAEQEGNWAKHLESFYTEDVYYTWNMGPYQQFEARGKREICDIALTYHMKGFEKWRYPFLDWVIDDARGMCVVFYRQIAPPMVNNKADGRQTVREVAGISGSKFEYAGGYKWKRQEDFFDLGNVKSLFFELAGENRLELEVCEKLSLQAHGNLLPGILRINNEPGVCSKINNFLSIVRVAILGR